MGVYGTTYQGVIPASLNGMTLVTSSVTANTWTQLIASTSSAILIVALYSSVPTNTSGNFLIGTGAAASETTVATLYAWSGTSGGGLEARPLVTPIRVPAGTRVAIRNSMTSLTMGIAYVAESKVV